MPTSQLLRLTLLGSLVWLAAGTGVRRQSGPPVNNPSTYPQVYPGMPSGPYGTDWQNYFLVNNSALPTNVSVPFTMYSGNIPTNTTGHPNNTLFFWAVENLSKPGSLTAAANASSDPWIIWLNGGPGASSMIGFFQENGPLRLQNNLSLALNNYTWSMLADTIWVDNPVGVGFSTADSAGYVPDETRTGEDFVGFLNNLVAVFPSLRTRPFYLTGESYGGVYIPYITKAIIEAPNPPVNVAKFAIGDGIIAGDESPLDATVISTLDVYPELIGYNQTAYTMFYDEMDACGFFVTLQYPQQDVIPYLAPVSAIDLNSPYYFNSSIGGLARFNAARKKRASRQSLLERTVDIERRGSKLAKREDWPPAVQRLGKRSMNASAVDPWYGCFLQDKMWDYAHNMTGPWSQGGIEGGVNVYDIPDAIYPDFPQDVVTNIQIFLQDNRTVAALHAPTSFEYQVEINYPFGPDGDTSIAPAPAFMQELVDKVPMLLFSGNDDSLLPHLGTEIVIQNLTFGGSKGFIQQPSTPWYNDDGTFAGIVHQEENVTYVRFKGAGHEVALFVPAASYVFVRDFLIGTNDTGRVITSNGTAVSVVGNNPSSSVFAISGGPIITGSATTAGTYSWPAETVAAWNTFISTASDASVAGPTPTQSATSGARRQRSFLFWPL